MQKYFNARIKMLEKRLDSYLTQETEMPQNLYEAMRFSVLGDAKRIRPLLTFATYEMLKGKKNLNSLIPILPAACAVEMIHAASLIHNDLPSIDNFDERRGEKSCHKKFGVPVAILTGDALITKAFEVLTEISDSEKALECIKIVSSAASTKGLIAGEVVDILSRNRKLKIENLRYINIKKKGSLLQAAVNLACIMYGADEVTTQNLSHYALNIGLAQKIIDDIREDLGGLDELDHRVELTNKESSRTTYSDLIGIDKSKKMVKRLLSDANIKIKNIPNNDVLLEFIQQIKERLP